MNPTFISPELNAQKIVNAYEKISNNLINDMETDVNNYETLPENCSTSIHLLAGAAAGIMEHCIVYPIDSVKTRMQSLAPSPNARYASVTDGLKKMIAKEGLLRPLKGMGIMVFGAGPAHALHFSSYEKLKRLISGTETGGKSPIAQMIAGSISTVLHDAIMNPADVIKQRVQMYNSPYKNSFNCAVSILKNEGIKAFYRSYTTQLTMNIPFQSIHFVVYEYTQNVINSKRSYDPSAHLISGGLAGIAASALTTPLDVCKTLLNTQEPNVLKNSKTSHINGFINAVTLIYKCCGIRGYFNGLQARILFSAPSTAISWTVYESFKYYLSLNKNK